MNDKFEPLNLRPAGNGKRKASAMYIYARMYVIGCTEVLSRDSANVRELVGPHNTSCELGSATRKHTALHCAQQSLSISSTMFLNLHC